MLKSGYLELSLANSLILLQNINSDDHNREGHLLFKNFLKTGVALPHNKFNAYISKTTKANHKHPNTKVMLKNINVRQLSKETYQKNKILW